MPEKIEHRIGIPVPAAVVWEVISDVAGWPAWNPIYPKAAGKVGFGERLSLTLALPEQTPREIDPVVFDWAPDEAIHWRTQLAGGLGWAVRFLEIEAMSESGCIFSNGEIFGGLFGPGTARRLRRPLKAGFAALGEAVKARAEALWRERGGEAT
ncbi:MAG: SRPBCC domain-containing protein [Caulobacteraceae bacterium]|nr:SRPBCC domain-containing protein [Caulobacteraceae bacterium]